MTDPFAEGVANPAPDGRIEVNEASVNLEHTQAQIRRTDAETDHQKAQSRDVYTHIILKLCITFFVAILLWVWMGFLFDSVDYYFDQMKDLKKEIPSQVMLAVIGAGATIVGLMGFILKGLFKSN